MGCWHCIVWKRGAMQFTGVFRTCTTSATSAGWTRRRDGGWMWRRPRNSACPSLSQRQWRKRCFWGLHATPSTASIWSVDDWCHLFLIRFQRLYPTFCNRHLCSIISNKSQRFSTISKSVSCDGSSLDWEFEARPGSCAITDSTFCNNHLCYIFSYESQRVSTFSKSVSYDGSSLDWELEARLGTRPQSQPTEGSLPLETRSEC